MILHENNMRFHLLASVFVLAFCFFVGLSNTEWCFIVIVLSSVWISEAFNTAIENLCDFVSSDYHLQIKIVKDIAAAAVLLTAIMAAIVGIIILAPKLLTLARVYF